MWPFKRKVKKLDPSKLFDVVQALRWTPDAADLEATYPWYIFVSDDLQYGHPRFAKLRDAGAEFPNIHRPTDPYYGYTVGNYVMWKHNAKSKSFVVPLDRPPKYATGRPEWDLTGPQALKVKGQIFKIDWRGIAELDEHYRNGLEYQRRKIRVVVGYHHLLEMTDGSIAVSLRHETMVDCLMYVGIQEFWDSILDGSFVPVTKIPGKSGVPNHYLFTNMEYKR